MKRYTYRTDNDINDSLRAKGVKLEYTVILAGVPQSQYSNSMTFDGARIELDLMAKVRGMAGMVIHVPTGEVVYSRG